METQTKKTASLSFVFLIALIIFHLISNLIWLHINNIPPPWDEAAHTKGAIEYSYFFSQALRGNFNLNLLRIPFFDPYLPLGKVIASIILFLTYPNVKIAQFTGSLFFIGSIFLMYLITKKITQSDWGALLSAVLISFAPHVLDRSHLLSLDIGVLFFYLLAFYFFVTSDNLKNKRASILFFISLGFSILTKFQAFIYFIPMALYEGIYLIKNGIKKPVIINICIGVFGASLLTIPIILSNVTSLRSYLSIATQSQFSAPSNMLDVQTWWYYIQQLTNGFFPLIYAPLLIIGWFFFFRFPSRQKLFLLTQFFGIYIILTFIANKGVRFFFPIIPSCLLISILGLVHFTKHFKSTRIIILLYVVLWGMLMNFTLSFSLFPLIKPVFYQNYNVVKPYDPHIYPFDNLINDILINGGDKNEKNLSILFIPNFSEFNLNSMNMYLRVGNINHITAAAIPSDELFQHYFNKAQIDEDKELLNYDYFVYSDTGFGDPWFIDLKNNSDDVQFQLQERIKQEVSNNSMSVIATYALPSGQTIHLAKRNR